MSVIDFGLKSAIVLHLFRNYAPAEINHPLILAITGPTGEGKTYQTDAAIAALGLKSHRIESGELESELAGQPAEKIRIAYLRAGANREGPGVLVINDLDTAVGDWGEHVQYTVNRQTVFGQLMSLCDMPTVVNGQDCPRVPIIVTGNDFSRLHPPLTRPGRMRTFPWVPNISQRMPIVGSLFPWLNSSELEGLMQLHPDQPVAFWAAVKASLDDEATLDLMSKLGEVEAIRQARQGKMMGVDYSAVSPSHVGSVADRLAASSLHENYLVASSGA